MMDRDDLQLLRPAPRAFALLAVASLVLLVVSTLQVVGPAPGGWTGVVTALLGGGMSTAYLRRRWAHLGLGPEAFVVRELRRESRIPWEEVEGFEVDDEPVRILRILPIPQRRVVVRFAPDDVATGVASADSEPAAGEAVTPWATAGTEADEEIPDEAADAEPAGQEDPTGSWAALRWSYDRPAEELRDLLEHWRVHREAPAAPETEAPDDATGRATEQQARAAEKAAKQAAAARRKEEALRRKEEARQRKQVERERRRELARRKADAKRERAARARIAKSRQKERKEQLKAQRTAATRRTQGEAITRSPAPEQGRRRAPVEAGQQEPGSGMSAGRYLGIGAITLAGLAVTWFVVDVLREEFATSVSASTIEAHIRDRHLDEDEQDIVVRCPGDLTRTAGSQVSCTGTLDGERVYTYRVLMVDGTGRNLDVLVRDERAASDAESRDRPRERSRPGNASRDQ